MKIGRNQPCPCGSGKKYKKCCANKPVPVGSQAPQTPIEVKYKALFDYNRELRAVVDTIMEKKFPMGADKDMFAAFCIGKAYKTQAAILLLCQQGYGQDAAILVRSLIELLITLLYILKDPTDERIQRYFAYDWIMRKKMYNYGKTKPEILEILKERNQNLKQGDNPIEEVEKQAIAMQTKYNYKKDWSDKNMREMAEEVGRVDLYLTVYRLQSQIMHTAPRVMNEYVVNDGKGITIEVGQNERWVEETLVTTFDCFYNIVGQYDKLLKLGFATKLDEIAKRYVEQVGEINKKA